MYCRLKFAYMKANYYKSQYKWTAHNPPKSKSYQCCSVSESHNIAQIVYTSGKNNETFCAKNKPAHEVDFVCAKCFSAVSWLKRRFESFERSLPRMAHMLQFIRELGGQQLRHQRVTCASISMANNAICVFLFSRCRQYSRKGLITSIQRIAHFATPAILGIFLISCCDKPCNASILTENTCLVSRSSSSFKTSLSSIRAHRHFPLSHSHSKRTFE